MKIQYPKRRKILDYSSNSSSSDGAGREGDDSRDSSTSSPISIAKKNEPSKVSVQMMKGIFKTSSSMSLSVEVLKNRAIKMKKPGITKTTTRNNIGLKNADENLFYDDVIVEEYVVEEEFNPTEENLEDNPEIKVIGANNNFGYLEGDDVIVEEYEIEEPVEENPVLKNISHDERIALEFSLNEMITTSKSFSQELDEKIPLNWESIAYKMEDVGYDGTTNPVTNDFTLPEDKAIYQWLLQKLKEQMDEQEAQHRISQKLEASKKKEESHNDDRDFQDDINMQEEDDEGDLTEDYVDEERLDQKIKCNCCHVMVKRRDMFEHQSLHRNDAPFKCKECGKTFRKKHPLKVHRRVHTTDKPFNCDICGMLFKAVASLKKHMRRHLGEEKKRFQCEFCNSKWASPYDLNVHRRTHTGEKPYLCPDCGASFAKVSNLNAHQRRHKNIRNYKCDECDRAFTSSTELNNHKVSHTGIKKYKCDLCGRSFGSNESLSRHKVRHPGLLNLLHCPTCNRKYRSQKGLQAHMNFGTCTEFKCPKCNLSFKSLNGLTAHHKRSKCMADVDYEAIIEEEEIDEPTHILIETEFMD